MPSDSLSRVRAKAGARGAIRRWGKPSGDAPPDPEPPNDSPDAGQQIPAFVRIIAGDLDPSVGKKMVAYLGLVGMPSDLNEIKVLEQVMAEAVKSAHNAMDLQVARGRLVPRADLDAAIAAIRDSWWRSAQQITSDLLAALPGLPIEARELIRKSADEAVQKAAARVKAEMTS